MKIRRLLSVSLIAIFALTAATAAAPAPERPPLLAVGSPAPNFTALLPNNSKMQLSDYKGKVVLVDFWATWCGPCKAAMPHVEQVYQQYKDKGLVVVGVCVWDDRANFDAWQKKPEVKTTYPKVFDPAGKNTANSIAHKLYNVSGIPTFYLINQQGKIAYAGVGSGSETETALDKALTKIMAGAEK